MPYSYDDDDDNEEDDDDEEEDDDDDSELIARVEKAFRTERMRIRTCKDLKELYDLQKSYQTLLLQKGQAQIVRVRSNDILELLDDRITDLRANGKV